MTRQVCPECEGKVWDRIDVWEIPCPVCHGEEEIDMPEMQPEWPTLEAEWDEFVAEVLPHFTEAQLEPYRKVFLAGFLSMLAIAMRASNREASPIERMKILRGYFEQHNAMGAKP